MAFFDKHIECSDRSKKHVRVPGNQGSSDRNIYVNRKLSGYRLGSSNNRIYTSAGREVSSACIEDFAKQCLWIWIKQKTKHFAWLFYFLNLCVIIYNNSKS